MEYCKIQKNIPLSHVFNGVNGVAFGMHKKIFMFHQLETKSVNLLPQREKRRQPQACGGCPLKLKRIAASLLRDSREASILFCARQNHVFA